MLATVHRQSTNPASVSTFTSTSYSTSISPRVEEDNIVDVVLILSGPVGLYRSVCDFFRPVGYACVRRLDGGRDAVARNEMLRPRPRKLAVCDSRLQRTFHVLAVVDVMSAVCPEIARCNDPLFGYLAENDAASVDLPFSPLQPSLAEAVMHTVFPFQTVRSRFAMNDGDSWSDRHNSEL